MTSILSDLYDKVQTESRVARFIKQFNVVRVLKESGFNKIKGFSLIGIVDFLLALVFTHKNMFRTMQSSKELVQFAKDTTYRFLNDPRSDWRQFQLRLGAQIIKDYLSLLTSKERVRTIVFDDSAYSRDRSKKVELLARVKDHVTGRYFKGFRKFTAGWTDGATFIPLAFALLSSANPKNRLYEQGPDIPQGSPGEHRRKEAVQPGTTVMLDMLDQILVLIRIYGLRWDIEVYFKMCKSFLRLAKEFQSRTYDAMIAHTTIVCIRYMLLAVENREQKDSRTHGEIFYQFCDEVTDLDFTQAFLYFLDLFTQTLRENLFLSELMVDQLLAAFMAKLPSFIKNRLCLNAA
ncbi:hypothetical protein BR63_04525 [Thermanaerosceptrum fracticalcis]|uniref:Transposase IS701-like DDE domain-containing protein n=1 Tax=Thermanaerosceptrum fracticalcis TaxID=1712410 RepID=A0A7G6E892_THEFR|nr:hypothetical protein BR63_04525 [Thermanaerosceptrum fracticalcis]